MSLLRKLRSLLVGTNLLLLRFFADIEFLVTGKTTSPIFGSLWLKKKGVEFQHPVSLGLKIYIRNQGHLNLGRRCSIGSFARIWNYNPIWIGDDFMCAGGLSINTASHDPIDLGFIGEEIHIGNRVWCGLNVTILSGVKIGDDVVIGAGSVVITDIPSNCIAVGVPAKKVKDLNRDEKTKIWRLDNTP